MEYIPLPAFVEFHKSRDTLRKLNGLAGSGKTTAAINEIGYMLPKWIFDIHGISKTRWIVISINSHVLFKGFLHWFPEATYSYAAGRMIIKHGEIEVEVLFISPHFLEHRYYTMPKGKDGKRHREWHLNVSFPKLMSVEMTGYYIESCTEHRDVLRRNLNMRIGRYPPRVPVRFGIEEEF